MTAGSADSPSSVKMHRFGLYLVSSPLDRVVACLILVTQRQGESFFSKSVQLRLFGGGKVQYVQILDDDRPPPTGGVSLMYRASNFDREDLRATPSRIGNGRLSIITLNC
jgi:hypothetical protein